jgi:hypothetical protein
MLRTWSRARGVEFHCGLVRTGDCDGVGQRMMVGDRLRVDPPGRQQVLVQQGNRRRHLAFGRLQCHPAGSVGDRDPVRNPR